jgi:tellurite resistance-related uncharacterized protein
MPRSLHDAGSSLQAVSAPYKTTPIFDEMTLPVALRNAHRTKAGVWGIIRILEGELRYVIEESSMETILTPVRPGLVLPEQLHHVQPVGRMRMQVEFYDHAPKCSKDSNEPSTI